MPSHLPDPAVARRALAHWETLLAREGVTGGALRVATAFRRGHDLITRMRTANIDTTDVVWLVPAGMCRGVVSIFGVPVQQVADLTHPVVAHPFGDER